jgi:hypothetical protein
MIILLICTVFVTFTCIFPSQLASSIPNFTPMDDEDFLRLNKLFTASFERASKSVSLSLAASYSDYCMSELAQMLRSEKNVWVFLFLFFLFFFFLFFILFVCVIMSNFTLFFLDPSSF